MNKLITPTDALKTFDFGSKEGTPQNDQTNKIIWNNILNNPDKSMYDEGESFNEAAARVLPKIKEILANAAPNTVVVTHNSVFGLIKLWDNEGRPETLNKIFRQKYINQDNKFPTGSFFTLKGDKGTIYIVRHGETEDNKRKVFRRANTELTEKGIKEAEQTGKELASVNIPKIISSSLPRAIHTSELILQQQNYNMALKLKPSSIVVKKKLSMANEEMAESAAEQKSEGPAKEVAEFIDCIMTGAVIAHKMHLRETGTGSYAAHKALNKLYEVLPEHADTIAEAYQGKMGIILPQVSMVDQDEYLAMNHLEYVEYLIKDVEEDRSVFGDCSTMQNLVDELLADLYSVRYKLKFLS